jgi:hypothetical protein
MRRWAEEALADDNPDALFMDGLDDAIVGVGCQYTKPTLVVYDANLIVEALVAQGMNEEDAAEYAVFNIFSAWVGEHTPIIVARPPAGAIADEG